MRFKMSPVDEARYQAQRAAMRPDSLELARMFQRLAFSVGGNWPDQLDGDFEPEPLYVQMAVEFVQPNWMEHFHLLVEEIRRAAAH